MLERRLFLGSLLLSSSCTVYDDGLIGAPHAATPGPAGAGALAYAAGAGRNGEDVAGSDAPSTPEAGRGEAVAVVQARGRQEDTEVPAVLPLAAAGGAAQMPPQLAAAARDRLQLQAAAQAVQVQVG